MLHVNVNTCVFKDQDSIIANSGANKVVKVDIELASIPDTRYQHQVKRVLLAVLLD